MPEKHPTSKVIDQHMHACASAQSDQDLWVFTIEKTPRKHMTNRVPDQHVYVHPYSLSRIFAIKKSKAVLSGTYSRFHWTFICRCFLKHTHSVRMNDRMSEQRNQQINERKDES